jgi:toxin CptA
VLDAWLIGLVAWVAAWGGVMLVHYFWIEKRWPGETARLFDGVGTKRLPGVNWAGVVSLLVGIFSTWLFMYGLVPAMQGPVAVALGGWDLSWLAGGLSSAATYAALGPRVHRRYVVNGGGPEPVSATAPDSALPEGAATAAADSGTTVPEAADRPSTAPAF